MIDLQGVFANSLWILALAALLALLSWSSWQAQREGVRFRVVWARPARQFPVALSLMLFCAGMIATADRWWERLLWALLALAWLAQPFGSWWSQKRAHKNTATPEDNA